MSMVSTLRVVSKDRAPQLPDLDEEVRLALGEAAVSAREGLLATTTTSITPDGGLSTISRCVTKASTGDPYPGAAVEFINVPKGWNIHTIGDAQGGYSVRLPAGIYRAVAVDNNDLNTNSDVANGTNKRNRCTPIDEDRLHRVPSMTVQGVTLSFFAACATFSSGLMPASVSVITDDPFSLSSPSASGRLHRSSQSHPSG